MSGVELNDRGTIAFWASVGETRGIFLGPDPVAHKVIALGDPLFGSTVTELRGNHGDLNDHDQIAFAYRLANNQTGVAVVTVPEPGAAALLLTAAALAAVRRRRRPVRVRIPPR